MHNMKGEEGCRSISEKQYEDQQLTMTLYSDKDVEVEDKIKRVRNLLEQRHRISKMYMDMRERIPIYSINYENKIKIKEAEEESKELIKILNNNIKRVLNIL